jgi:hypothetical protein
MTPSIFMLYIGLEGIHNGQNGTGKRKITTADVFFIDNIKPVQE